MTPELTEMGVSIKNRVSANHQILGSFFCPLQRIHSESRRPLGVSGYRVAMPGLAADHDHLLGAAFFVREVDDELAVFDRACRRRRRFTFFVCLGHGDDTIADAQAIQAISYNTTATDADYFSITIEEGHEVTVTAETFEAFGDFDMVLAGWGPDYDDPLTFGDLFASWNLNNRGNYRNPELDKWVRVAQNEQDTKTRMDAFGEIQRILIEDAVILPNYERGITYVTHPQLKGMVRRAVGPDPDFSNAWIEGD